MFPGRNRTTAVMVFVLVVALVLLSLGGCRAVGGNAPIYNPHVCTSVDGSFHTEVPCPPEPGVRVTQGSQA